MSEDQSLAQTIKQNQIANELATVQRDQRLAEQRAIDEAQAEADRKQAEKEYNQFIEYKRQTVISRASKAKIKE